VLWRLAVDVNVMHVLTSDTTWPVFAATGGVQVAAAAAAVMMVLVAVLATCPRSRAITQAGRGLQQSSHQQQLLSPLQPMCLVLTAIPAAASS
jgi:Mg2+/Co2+ transporter CorB